MKLSIILLLFLLLESLSCKKSDCDWDSPPNILYFIIKENGKPLEYGSLSEVKMYYLRNGIKITNPNDIDTSPNSPILDDTKFIYYGSKNDPKLENSGVLANGYADFVSTLDIKTWYIEFPDGNIDTLFLETTKLSCEEAKLNRCYCNLPFTKVIFNGRIVKEATEIQTTNMKPVYCFEK